MRILCLIDSLGSGGAQRQMTILVNELSKKGYKVTLVCYNKNDFFLDQINESQIQVSWIISRNYFHRVLRLRKFIRTGEFDVVISFLTVPNFINCIAAIGGKKWKIITAERSAKQQILESFKGKLFGHFQKYSDHIVCNSINARSLWREFYPEYKNKLKVIYNAVDIPKISSVYTPKKNGILHVVVAASFQRLKNPIGMIDAVNLLSDEEKRQLRITWYGKFKVAKEGTETYEICKRMIKEYNLEQTIILNKETKYIYDKMYESDIVALFSKLEGMPNTIIEGMMAGKPIIMTKVSDYKVLIDNNNGFVCNWNDPMSIKNTISSAISLEPEQLINMGKVSKSRAINLFSVEKIINDWIKLINHKI